MAGPPLKFVACVLLGVVLMRPTGGAQAKIFDPKTFKLANGLQAVVIENRRAPVVHHMVWYKAGAIDEPPGMSGIAHFLEHLMFKGTDKIAPGAFSKIIAANGGRDNAFTSWDYTGYHQSVAKDRLSLVMEMEADRMRHLRLRDRDVTAERDVILEERSSRIDNRPAGLLGEQIRAALYMNHPYGRPIIGWRHEMARLSKQDAFDFYHRYYAPNNAVLVVAGDVDAAGVKALAERHYGPIPAAAEIERNFVYEPVHHAPRRVVLAHPLVGQASWQRHYLAPSHISGKSKYAYALQVLSEILGGGPTSRLYRALLVEQGIATGAGSYYSPGSLGLTTFSLYGSPGNGHMPADIETAMEAEITRILADGVTEAEVARAIKTLTDGAVFARDSLRTAPQIFGEALAIGRNIEDVEAWPERIAAVTAEQVLAAARHVFVAKSSVTGELLPAPAPENPGAAR